MIYTDGSSTIEAPEPEPGCSDRCAFALTGEHEPGCYLPGQEYVIVNPESMWYGLTGRVDRVHDYRGSKTVYLAVGCSAALPFGASEVAR